jgi:2-polyprenyl-3-methyl-5-hydroxy-6-metoxy-1,4-benzoquinol methylase
MPDHDSEITTISPKPADWTEEHIARIWDWYSFNPYIKNLYFTFQEGRAIVKFLTATDKLHGNILDFGCGVGDLLALLLERGLSCHGAEHSEKSVEYVNQRFKDHPHWQECSLILNFKTDFPDSYFDLITLIETIEHIPDNRMHSLFFELKRLLKPEGTIIITTPYNENLEKELIYCPFCETIFHRWQHLKSFSEESMTKLISDQGLQSFFCKHLDFDQFISSPSLLPLKYLSLSKFYQWLRFKKCILSDRLFRKHYMQSCEFQHRLTMGNRRHLCTLTKKN